MPPPAIKAPQALAKRQRMTPATRRAKIIDAAQTLFLARGWDAVTITEVLDAAGISKGGFYHHFSAKEDLLDAIVERFAKDALTTADAFRAETKGDALVRFNAFLATSIRWKAEHGPQMRLFMDVMLRPGNAVLSYRISCAVAGVARPILRDMIAEGAAEGRFDVGDTDLVVEMILALPQGRTVVAEAAIQTADGGDIEAAAEILNNRMVAEGRLIDRLLGLPAGSVVLSNLQEYRMMLQAMTDN